jgi:hypothetical protein
MIDEELDSLYKQVKILIQQRLDDIRAELRAAQAKVVRLSNHPHLTMGDSAALIEIRRILSDVEDRLQMMQKDKPH